MKVKNKSNTTIFKVSMRNEKVVINTKILILRRVRSQSLSIILLDCFTIISNLEELSFVPILPSVGDEIIVI